MFLLAILLILIACYFLGKDESVARWFKKIARVYLQVFICFGVGAIAYKFTGKVMSIFNQEHLTVIASWTFGAIGFGFTLNKILDMNDDAS